MAEKVPKDTKSKTHSEETGSWVWRAGPLWNVLAILCGWWWNSYRSRHPAITILLKGQIAELKI